MQSIQAQNERCKSLCVLWKMFTWQKVGVLFMQIMFSLFSALFQLFIYITQFGLTKCKIKILIHQTSNVTCVCVFDLIKFNWIYSLTQYACTHLLGFLSPEKKILIDAGEKDSLEFSNKLLLSLVCFCFILCLSSSHCI